MDGVGSATPAMMPLNLDAISRTPNDPKARETAAHGFESMFASMLVKEMRQGLDEGGFFGADSGDIMGGMFDHFMGQHIAQQGRLGIADMLKRQWARAT